MTGRDHTVQAPGAGDALAAQITRSLSPTRAAIGAARLLFPALSLPGINAASLGAGGRKVVQVLGARHLVQAALTGRDPTRETLSLGAAIDAAHAASMFGLALFSPRYRRAALGDAVVAGALAAAGARAARKAPAAR